MKQQDPIDFNKPRPKQNGNDVVEVKIKCRYCDLKDTCKRRPHKESYENSGWTTKCTLTPNRPGKKRKARKRK